MLCPAAPTPFTWGQLCLVSERELWNRKPVSEHPPHGQGLPGSPWILPRGQVAGQALSSTQGRALSDPPDPHALSGSPPYPHIPQLRPRPWRRGLDRHPDSPLSQLSDHILQESLILVPVWFPHTAPRSALSKALGILEGLGR